MHHPAPKVVPFFLRGPPSQAATPLFFLAFFPKIYGQGGARPGSPVRFFSPRKPSGKQSFLSSVFFLSWGGTPRDLTCKPLSVPPTLVLVVASQKLIFMLFSGVRPASVFPFSRSQYGCPGCFPRACVLLESLWPLPFSFCSPPPGWPFLWQGRRCAMTCF